MSKAYHLTRIRKDSLMAKVRNSKHNTFVRVVPCKMYPGADFSCDITLKNTESGIVVVRGDETQDFDTWYNNWAYYNANNECGLYAHYYVIAD